MKYIGGLSTVLLEYVQMKYIGGLSTVPSKCIQMKYIIGLSTVLSESVQLKYIGGLSTVLSESIQMRKKKEISDGGPTFYQSLSNEPSLELKQKPFVLKKIKKILTWKKCMCEEVGDDSRHGAWHEAFM